MKKHFLLCFIISSHIIGTTCISRTDSLKEINNSKLLLSGGMLIAADAGSWIALNNSLLRGPKAKLHSINDWYGNKINIDKLGHLHGTTVLSKLAYHWLKWTNIPEDQAQIYSSVTSLLIMLQLELSDGQIDTKGFSWSDMGFNTIGSTYSYLQHKYPILNNINIKVSYFPSEEYLRGEYKNPISDYEGKTYWLTFHPHDFLNESVKNIYPDWLGFAIGYGGENLINSHNKKYNSGARQEWFASFDIDFIKLFKPSKDTIWYTMLDLLNTIHLPLPAIKLNSNCRLSIL